MQDRRASACRLLLSKLVERYQVVRVEVVEGSQAITNGLGTL